MEIIIHKVNKINQLIKLPTSYGCEIDLRTYNSKIVLNHEPYFNGEDLENYLDNYKHGTLVLNIKESGIEDDVIKKVKERNIDSYFLLDVEFPYLYNTQEKNIALRFSEFEPSQALIPFKNKFDWIWIDSITKNPVNSENIDLINNFKSCFVCPSRWTRPNDIELVKNQFKILGFKPNLIMTETHLAKKWL